MKAFIFFISIIISVQALYSKNFKETEDIINTILKEEPDEQKREDSKKSDKEKKMEQMNDMRGTKEREEKNDEKKVTMSLPDEILLTTGIDLFNSRMYDNAENKFRDLIEKFPNSKFIDSANLRLGIIKIKKHNYNEAIKLFQAIKNDSGEFPTAQFNIGLCYINKKEQARSIEYFTRVSSRFPDHELADNALLNSGNIYLNLNKGNKALEIAVKLIKNYKGRETIDDAYYLLGKIFERDPKLNDPQIVRKIYRLFIKKADSGMQFFKNSPLRPKVARELKFIENKYFNLEN